MGVPFLATTSPRDLDQPFPSRCLSFLNLSQEDWPQVAPEALYTAHHPPEGASSGLGGSQTGRVAGCFIFQKDLHQAILPLPIVLFTVKIPFESTESTGLGLEL